MGIFTLLIEQSEEYLIINITKYDNEQDKTWKQNRRQGHSIGPYSAMIFLSLICIVDKSLSFVVIYRMCWRQIYFLLLIFDILDINHSVSAFLSIFIIIGSYLDG